jgi:hypothetical protein
MPMMVVDDNDFDIELKRIAGTSNKKDIDEPSFKLETPNILEVIRPIERGRGHKPEVPSELRKLIAQSALNGEPHKEIMERFGVSQSSVSAYSAGATSTARIKDNPDAELSQHNDRLKTEISSDAAIRLQMALGTITPEKLERAKLRDAASVARDMSAIMKNMTRDKDSGNGINQQVIVYQPRSRQEDTYEVIEVHSH